MRRKQFAFAGTLVLSVIASGLAQTQGDASWVLEQKVEPPVRPIYDEHAEGQAQIAQTLAQAEKNNTRVLIQWGANWCSWCTLLHGAMTTDADLKKELLYEYEVIHVDIGKWDKHMDLAAGYGADLKANGVPFLTVLDAEGKAIANQETGSLEATDGTKGHDVAKVLAFLTQHEAPRVKADDLLARGLETASAEHKRVFLHFGAPWCGWCRRLEGWMERPEVAEVLDKHFVDVKIDVDRAVAGQDMLSRYTKGQSTGIPFFLVLDAQTQVLADSMGRGGNLGFPYSPEEVADFRAMLAKADPTFTPEELDTLIKSVGEFNKSADEAHGG